ncbi:ribonuclease P subunit P29 [Candidatus Caldarchaeum subterraneum]|uniref:Ribonuclease P protein component 1 n=1 Tax=Caldiarchaeum subterraneum TaxID=311458 RepID=E6N5E2_CALS0|nr:ribonuclease P subunit P29 [Candidatus Caldarchaeum subterraneum]BAJ50327.1 ribonuclease P subunit P29 [Candidatus Caldarchaeum subterraneum]GBC72330.1 hypothetical protein HRbin03_00157 [archaeon HR03]
MTKPLNIYLLGKRVKVMYNNKTSEGVVVSETRNMVMVKTMKGAKSFPKMNSVFIVDGKVVEGVRMVARPFERLLRGGGR